MRTFTDEQHAVIDAICEQNDGEQVIVEQYGPYAWVITPDSNHHVYPDGKTVSYPKLSDEWSTTATATAAKGA